jgi:hypothetical protein
MALMVALALTAISLFLLTGTLTRLMSTARLNEFLSDRQ